MGRDAEKRLTQSLQVVRARVEVVGRVHALCKVCLDQYYATGTCTKQQKSVDKRGVDRVKHRQGGILRPRQRSFGYPLCLPCPTQQSGRISMADEEHFAPLDAFEEIVPITSG